MPSSSPEQGGSTGDPITLECTQTAISCGSAPVSVLECNAAGAAPTNVPAPSPWLRPQPDIPYCPVCPVKGGKLTLSLNPDHSTGTSVLNNPTFEFRLANGNYMTAGLGQITVDADSAEVDLERYRFTVGNTPQSIATALTANNVTAATLGFYIVDTTTGDRTRATSAVSVSP